MTINANLRHVIYALSDALDLVGVDDVAHGKRVGIMAAECGRVEGLAECDTSFLFDLGMLHDIGVSSTRTHSHLVGKFDWDGSQVHCEVGYALLKSFEPFRRMALPVRYHHTRWENLLQTGLPPETQRQANLTYLVDRVDALAAPHYADGSLLLFTDEIRGKISEHAGTYFSPELVELYLEASRTEAFWLMLEPRAIQAYLNDLQARCSDYPATTADLKRLAAIFARIVDAKSPFTAEHSVGVSRLARFLAERLGVSIENCEKLEIAGLLHDLGKLRVPDEILEKPGRLDKRERKIINTHSYETFQILRNIRGFEEITRWAAYHHEEPDGSGYPFHLKADAMPLEARILRIADIFQAMVQTRPYRNGLSDVEVAAFMRELSTAGRVDARIVDVLLAELPAARHAACPKFAALPDDAATGAQ
ncbi:MAG: HD domain-containing protein [Zoogloea sp.]|jgi:putative nucleotidyltransferase with HDIG domain|nr:HD domain-containing protein [Zoogloea sp.]